MSVQIGTFDTRGREKIDVLRCEPAHTDEVTYEATEWPIFRVTMPSVQLSEGKFREHLDHITAVYERREPFALLVDSRRAPPLNAAERQAVAEAMRFCARRNPGVLRGLAVCLSSAVARGGFTAITWLARPPYPTAAFESVPKASVWLKQKLATPTSSDTVTLGSRV